jgi:hypothetical protein
MRAYDATGPLDLDTIGWARIGAMTVIHETDHHQHPAGDENAPDAVRFYSPEAAWDGWRPDRSRSDGGAAR